MDLKMMRRLSSQSTRTDPQNYSLSSGAGAGGGGGGGEKRSGLNMNKVGSMGFFIFGVVFRDQHSYQMPVPDVSQSQTPAFKQKPRQPGCAPAQKTRSSLYRNYKVLQVTWNGVKCDMMDGDDDGSSDDLSMSVDALMSTARWIACLLLGLTEDHV